MGAGQGHEGGRQAQVFGLLSTADLTGRYRALLSRQVQATNTSPAKVSAYPAIGNPEVLCSGR